MLQEQKQSCKLYVQYLVNTSNGISLCIYEWVIILEAKSGVLKMKWFLKNKMEALSVKV